jgi:hypothetical protein
MGERKGRSEVEAVRRELRRDEAIAVPAVAKIEWSEHRRDVYDVEAVHETWAEVIRCAHGHIVGWTNHAGAQTMARCEAGARLSSRTPRGRASGRKSPAGCTNRYKSHRIN